MPTIDILIPLTIIMGIAVLVIAFIIFQKVNKFIKDQESDIQVKKPEKEKKTIKIALFKKKPTQPKEEPKVEIKEITPQGPKKTFNDLEMKKWKA